LLSLKSSPKQSDVLVTAVNASHPSVEAHRKYVALGDVEAKAAKKALREEKLKEVETSARREVGIRELWKPHLSSVALFKEEGKSTTALYTLVEMKSIVNDYITSRNLVNPQIQAYINLDPLLASCISSGKSAKGKSKGKEPETREEVEFMKRDELTKAILDKMQSWYEVKVEGKDPIVKKGSLKPIQVAMKMRQGRKASTLITGFEPFLVIDAEEMAEDLRKVCAGATSVSPVAGKPVNSGLEVLVQGKQSAAVVEYLMGKGISKKWIEVSDLIGKK